MTRMSQRAQVSVPGKTAEKRYNCQFKPGTGCVSFGFTHLREWQPACGGAHVSQSRAGVIWGPNGSREGWLGLVASEAGDAPRTRDHPLAAYHRLSAFEAT